MQSICHSVSSLNHDQYHHACRPIRSVPPLHLCRDTGASRASWWTETRRGWRSARRRTSWACAPPPPARSTSTTSRCRPHNKALIGSTIWRHVTSCSDPVNTCVCVNDTALAGLLGAGEKHLGPSGPRVQVRHRDAE